MPKIQVVFHDGTSTETEVATFDAAAINEALNDETKTSVLIGDVIAYRGTVARVVKVPAPVTTATTTK